MAVGYVVALANRYIAKDGAITPQTRSLIFMDVLECEVPELMQDHEWRNEWFIEGKLPHVNKPTARDLVADGRLSPNATSEQARAIIRLNSKPVDQNTVDAVWRAIDEALKYLKK